MSGRQEGIVPVWAAAAVSGAVSTVFSAQYKGYRQLAGLRLFRKCFQRQWLYTGVLALCGGGGFGIFPVSGPPYGNTGNSAAVSAVYADSMPDSRRCLVSLDAVALEAISPAAENKIRAGAAKNLQPPLFILSTQCRATGITAVNTVPFSASLETVRAPSCRSIMLLAIARPRP